MKKYDLIIIGAGSGGLSAAAGAAKLGLKVLLVEKNKLGGDCLWNGCIPSKTLIHEAEKMRIINEEIFPNGNNENTDKIIFDFQKHFKEAQKRFPRANHRRQRRYQNPRRYCRTFTTGRWCDVGSRGLLQPVVDDAMGCVVLEIYCIAIQS